MAALARRERDYLCDLLTAVGPEAGTLCEGWTTRDLAAHLVVRDRRPDSLPGLMVPAFSGHTEKVRVSCRDHHDYPRLVELVRSGPMYPVRLAKLDAFVNGLEYLVHHEDVVRAQPDWAKADDAERDTQAWGRLGAMAKMLGKPSPVGLVLAAPGHDPITARRPDPDPGGPSGTVHGSVVDVILWGFGRHGPVEVEIDGDPEVVEALSHLDLGG
jgi:uncharacterized protein (TIGR03085 family)